MGERAEQSAAVVAESIRNDNPSLAVQQHCGAGNFKKQMKKALASGAKLAVIVGDDELTNDTLTVKFLADDREQISVAMTDVSSLSTLLS
jgi:histidyl-tRNA synthetase